MGEVLIAIALLCAGDRSMKEHWNHNRFYEDALACQKAYLKCIDENAIFRAEQALKKCVQEKK